MTFRLWRCFLKTKVNENIQPTGGNRGLAERATNLLPGLYCNNKKGLYCNNYIVPTSLLAPTGALYVMMP